MTSRTCIALLALTLFLTPLARAEEPTDPDLPPGEEIAHKINARDDGALFLGALRIELIDRHGSRMVRDVRTVRRDVDGQRQSVFVFDSPADLRGTGLLLYDHADVAQDDDQWLYLPAARKVRRIATGDRGGYFAGTDFTFEDMKNGSKVSIEDYRWKTLRRDSLEGIPCYVVEASAIRPEVAEELGYGRVRFWVDAQIFLPRRAEVWDPAGEPLKTIDTRDVRQVEGIWTAHEIDVEQHQTGHRTVLRLTRAAYSFPSSDDMFTQQTLVRGLRTPE